MLKTQSAACPFAALRGGRGFAAPASWRGDVDEDRGLEPDAPPRLRGGGHRLRQGGHVHAPALQVITKQARSSPVQSSPVQSSAVQCGPVQSGIVQWSPVQSSQVRSGAVRYIPVEPSSVQSSAVQSVLSSPVQSCPVQSSPVQSSAVSSLVQSCPVRSSQSSPLGTLHVDSSLVRACLLQASLFRHQGGSSKGGEGLKGGAGWRSAPSLAVWWCWKLEEAPSDWRCSVNNGKIDGPDQRLWG
eukprot:2244404-Pyramimonas_sp.AAC.1